MKAGWRKRRGSLLEVLPRNGDGLAGTECRLTSGARNCRPANTNATVVTVGINTFCGHSRQRHQDQLGDVKFPV